MTITLRPGLLEDFADVADEAVADLRTLLPDAIDAVHQYQWLNPDHGVDVTAPLDGTARLTAAIDGLGDEVARLARAARDLDDDLDDLGMATVDGDALDGRVQELVASWRTVTDLRDMVQPMGRDRWNELVWGPIPPNCGPAATYRGGGAVVGPDGRTYPLVIPEVLGEDGEIYRASSPAVGKDLQVSTLNGTDPGWTIDHIETGTARLQDAISGPLRFAVWSLGFNPQVKPVTSSGERALRTVKVTPAGWPAVTTTEPGTTSVQPDIPPAPDEVAPQGAQPAPRDEVLAPNPDAFGQPHSGHDPVQQSSPGPVARGADRAFRQRNAIGAGVDVAVGALEGVALLDNADRHGRAAFQLVFETHPDGRRRVQLRTYRMTTHEDGSFVIDPSAAVLGDDGELELRPLRFRQPQSDQPSLGPNPTPDAVPTRVLHWDTQTEARTR